jgi:DNA (cytosine-5)-methyltransferase 1
LTTYYNEIDLAAAAILRHLVAIGVIAHGDVDTRSIKDVQPDDLRGYTQCHFFAGGGLWSVAARMAGWADDRPLWTGSCPCQPFSAAGKGGGTDDPRHLWPDFHRLIRACRPPIVVGEQVAGAAGYGWLDGVRADLAGENYASRGVDIPACAVDAPHQRNRLYWVALALADSGGQSGRSLRGPGEGDSADGQRPYDQSGRSDGRQLVDPSGLGRREGWSEHELRGGRSTAPGADASSQMADGAGGVVVSRRPDQAHSALSAAPGDRGVVGHGTELADAYGCRNGSNWADADWIVCHDGKARRAKPGLRDVAHGFSGGSDPGNSGSASCSEEALNYRLLVPSMPGRVDAWRVAGNAIVPVEAAEVLAALLETEARTYPRRDAELTWEEMLQ